MSPLVQILGETAASAETPRAASRERAIPSEKAPHPVLSRHTPVHHEQLQSLVQQLFFQRDIGSPRHIGLTAADRSTEIASLCFDVAYLLSEESASDIGLIDASPGSAPLQTQLDVASAETSTNAWPLAPHLWLIPRQRWMAASNGHMTEQSILRLRKLAGEFDRSILCCPSVSWVTARIGRLCDGLVLVLAAHKTRLLVATQMKNLLREAQVPLLGTVLTERRFPLPHRLYRSL